MRKIWVLLCVLMGSVQGMCNDLSWNPPQTISGGQNSSNAQVVMDLSGNVTAAWVEGGFVQAKTLPAGGVWSSAKVLSGSGASSPNLGIDSSGNVTAVWLESIGAVKAATKPSGGSWGAAATLVALAASAPTLAVDGPGNAIAAWVVAGLISTNTKLAGGNWGILPSSFTNISSSSPRAAIGNGMGLLVWHAVSSGQDQILASTGTLGGAWGTAKVVNLSGSAGHNANYPVGSVDNQGNALVAWFRSDFGGSSGTDYISVLVLGSTLASGATTWAVPVQLSAAPGMRNPSGLNLKTSFDSNRNALILWSDSLDGATFNIESNLKANSGNLSGVNVLTAQNDYAFQFDFSINSFGDAVVDYMNFDGVNVNIQAVETNVDSFHQNFFSTPITISRGPNNGYPRVATALTGSTVNAAAVWTNSPDGVSTQIQAATGSKTILGPPSNVTVVQNVSNFGAFSDFYNTVTWQASTDPTVIGYVIYRNGIVITNIGNTTLQIVDHNQAQNGPVTYGVAAFDSEFSQSLTINQSLP